MDPRQEVETFVQRHLTDLARKDLAAVMAAYEDSPEAVAIGTGVDERAVGPEEIRARYERSFQQSERMTATLGWPRIGIEGDVAWVAADARVTASVGGREETYDGRLTMVLRRKGGTWRMTQSHFSLPFPTQAEGRAFPEAKK